MALAATSVPGVSMAVFTTAALSVWSAQLSALHAFCPMLCACPARMAISSMATLAPCHRRVLQAFMPTVATVMSVESATTPAAAARTPKQPVPPARRVHSTTTNASVRAPTATTLPTLKLTTSPASRACHRA